ncbi:MAG: hypothetical protein WCE52_05920 [Candidatus Acidiferrum sp.]
MDQIRDWGNWGVDWAWGLPLIVATVVFHAYGLGMIGRMTRVHLAGKGPIRNISAVSVLAMGGTALFATLLHGFESILWAASYRLVGAASDNRAAMLYSLSAMTTYGHENVRLAAGWQLMGALEALNGWILFGLTTAFLFSVMQRAWAGAEAEC